MKGQTLAERMASLLTAEPETGMGEDDDAQGLDARDGFVDSEDSDNETERLDKGMQVDESMTKQRSSLRKSAGLGMESILSDPKYAGKKTSRASLATDQGVDSTSEEDSDSDGVDGSEAKGVALNSNVIDSEEVSGDDSHEGSEDEQDLDEEEEKLRKSLEALEAEDEQEAAKGISHFSKTVTERDDEVTKGVHTRHLLTLCESVVETRIRLQQALNLNNQFPQADVLPLMLERGGADLTKSFEAAKKSTCGFIDSLLELQSELLLQGGSEILSKKRKRRPSLSEGDSSSYHKYTKSVEQDIAAYRSHTLQGWHTKLLLSSSNASSKQLKSVNRDIPTQVDQMMADSDTLVKRTQLKRLALRPMGKVPTDTESAEKGTDDQIDKAAREENYDPEVFDDNDFYHQILREFIASKSRFSGDTHGRQGMRKRMHIAAREHYAH
ncbi:hypothetical protein SARC_05629 [Sphaeroforma arctica JP610]|uniref:AATF leucine zipper-containing domain-containing protein n=1 Tax=Sphaeroforma arctica JP610 TaxID=667725 RepID=A0A0L0G1N3_9EUKA|nr:hypothetical protein SARC_05629 [Sphaeroforma arctica JP610]KNC82078.1 hypothetical protein SARC_05629 [Sphaeroforma arctica JP610]|eukprot:XP_014155980.1 hypothetical protein SARC_05629 [Sphaeroforma arctica JP610]